MCGAACHHERMSFDFDAAVTAPFRMQPGLRKLAAGARQLTPLRFGDAALDEKLAVLSMHADRALLAAPGFDAGPALDVLCRHAAAEHPDAWTWDGRTATASKLGLAVEGDTVRAVDAGAESFVGSHALSARDSVAPRSEAVRACIAASRPGWRIATLLSLAFAEDFAVIDVDSGSIPWVAVCLPSHWSPAEKVGRPFTEVHAPVADNRLIVNAAAHLMRLVSGGERWERFVWNITSHPRLDAHPLEVARERWPAEADAEALGRIARWRTERQTFLPLPAHRQAVFMIHVELQPLALALRSPERAAQVADALASMSPAVLEYRGLASARERLLQWLARRAAAP